MTAEGATGTERRRMNKVIYDWFELEKLEKAAMEGELLDIDLAEIRRNKLIMYLCYKERIEKQQAEMRAGFWDIISIVDATRVDLVNRFGEDAVLEVERCAVETAEMIEDIEGSLQATWDMFSPPGEEVSKLAMRMNLNDKHIAAIGLAACAAEDVTGNFEKEPNESASRRASINYEKFANKLINKKDPFSPKFMRSIHNLAAGALSDAMQEYVNGNPAKLGNLLRAGIRKTCEMFADARDPQDAAKRSGQLKEMLDVIEINPKLKQAVGLSPEENNAAYGAVVMGETVYRGLKSLRKLQDAGLSNTELPENIKTECMTDILQMQIVLNDRNKQIEIFKGTQTIKLPPSDMQKTFGSGATIFDVKAGKWPRHVKNMRDSLSGTQRFREQIAEPTFVVAKRLGNEERRKTLTHAMILDMQKDAGKKLATQSAAKKKEVAPAKELKTPKELKPPTIEGPVLGGPSAAQKSNKDRK